VTRPAIAAKRSSDTPYSSPVIRKTRHQMRAATTCSNAVGFAHVARRCGPGYDLPAGNSLDVPVQLFRVGIVFRIAG